MELVRLGASGCRHPEDAVVRNPEASAVEVMFRNFGLGTDRINDFSVQFSWQDVERLISEFVVMKEPSAVSLQAAKSLGVAAGRAGWHPKAPP